METYRKFGARGWLAAVLLAVASLAGLALAPANTASARMIDKGRGRRTRARRDYVVSTDAPAIAIP